MIETLLNKVLEGKKITKDEALALSKTEDQDLEKLYDAASIIRKHFCGNSVDICSIINVKSGLCSENCRYCAQSAHHNTGIEVYPLLDAEKVIKRAKEMEKEGAHRFSLITSGRGLTGDDFEKVVEIYRRLKAETKLKLCASLGIITEKQLKRLKEVGVERYHHNLETSEQYFPKICTSHSFKDRIETIEAAIAVGLEVCSGGIISMGETMEDRIDMAITLRDLGVKSVPVNILNPIVGTPLENQPIISVEEILKTIAILRFLLPDAFLRYAGGRENALAGSEIEGYKAGINAVLVGSYLTTSGKTVEEDLRILKEMGFEVDRV